MIYAIMETEVAAPSGHMIAPTHCQNAGGGGPADDAGTHWAGFGDMVDKQTVAVDISEVIEETTEEEDAEGLTTFDHEAEAVDAYDKPASLSGTTIQARQRDAWSMSLGDFTGSIRMDIEDAELFPAKDQQSQSVIWDDAFEAVLPETHAGRPVEGGQLSHGGEMEAQMLADVKGVPVVTDSHATLAHMPVRSTHAGESMSRQIVEAVVRMDGNTAEIALSPAELGSVQIVLTRDSQGLVITLSAERWETLELMRRHAELLHKELSAMGESPVRLEYSTGDDGAGAECDRQWAGQRHVQEASEPGTVTPDGPADARRALAVGRVDIRI